MIKPFSPSHWKNWLAAILLLAGIPSQAQDMYISEVVPDNDGSFVDADGDASDWIELYNHTSTAIDLAGWHLTDSADALTQWTFPSTTIAPGGLLIIFASGKDRALASQELHTNFKLKSSGEYVALVHPDGTTIEDGYAYPELPEGVSYGREFGDASETVLLDEGALCSIHIPENATDQAGWQQPGFNDAAWRTGQTGIGYDARSGFESLIQTSLLDMRYKNTSAYLRLPFILPNPESATGLRLEMKYDDGFVIFLNGERVLAENTDGTEEWNSGAGGARNDMHVLDFETFDLSTQLSKLQTGTNVLAIHALNDSIDLQDLLILPKLTARFASGINTGSPAILESATPGHPNAQSKYKGYVEQPAFLPEHGIYETPQTVSISCTTTGAVIRYTTDGSEPTTNSLAYTGPLTISSTTVLRARAFSNDWKPSQPRTESYIFLDDVIQQPADSYTVNRQLLVFGMDPEVISETYTDASNRTFTIEDALKAIPSLCITTDENNLFDPDTGIYVNAYERWERPASLELINPDGSEGFSINTGLRIRGGASRTPLNPKHSFRFFFREEYGASKLRFPMFGNEGVDEFDKIDLRTAQNYSWARSKDPRNTFLRDIFCRDSARDMGDEYTRSRYYHLYLNGIYWGLFMTEERPEARHAAAYLGGDSEDYDTVKRKSGRVGVEATDGNLHAYTRLFDAAMAGFSNNAAYFAVQGMDENGLTDPARERLVDTGNMIDYLLMIYYAGATDNCITWFNRDSSVNNMYALYNRENPDGFKWYQHDSEHAFDTSSDPDRTGPFPHENFLLVDHFNAQTLHEKLCANPEYRLAVADRVYKHFTNNGALMQHNSEARLDARAAQIDRAIVANAARWGNSQLNRDCWLNAAAKVRGFFEGRCEQVIDYLRNDGLIPSTLPPQSATDSFGVSLSAEEGSIYYTLDDSDPRAIGGAASGQLYTGRITLSQPTIIRARALAADGEWSAEKETVFQTLESPLAFTEVMYHAPSNQLDFIEIQNTSSEPVHLSGYSISRAVDFSFDNSTLAPDAYAVIAKDTNTFLSVYTLPPGTLLFEYSDDLDNSGETITLRFATEKLLSIRYSDARNWPQAADGGGHSLVPVAAVSAEALNYGGNWRASGMMGGSPGTADPEISKSIVINEVVAHTDTALQPPFDSNDRIELYNASPLAINISGWFLSDHLNDLQKYQIPDGSIIGPGEFLLFDEDDFHPGRTSGFGLDKAGELAILSTPERIVDAIRFKGQENGASLGRWTDGGNDWLPMPPTPGSSNQGAVSPLIITELMYHPANQNELMEYVLLQNTSRQPLSLATPAGKWRIAGGIDYIFTSPLGVGESLWLVPFSPENDIELLNEFCSLYNLNRAHENFAGPYHGRLSNSGDRVAVEYPQASDDPLNPDDISYIILDELFYSDSAPWPEEADGTGLPLIRTGLTSWSVPRK